MPYWRTNFETTGSTASGAPNFSNITSYEFQCSKCGAINRVNK